MEAVLLRTLLRLLLYHIQNIKKKGLFFIPAILILPGLFGITGLQLAQPVADGLTFILTQAIVVMVVKELRGMAENGKKCNN